MAPRRRRKTPAEIAIIRPLVRTAYLAGAWPGALAKEHDLDPGTVMRMIRDLRVPGTKVLVSSGDTAEILKRTGQGQGVIGISRDLGLSSHRVQRVVWSCADTPSRSG